MADNKKDIEDKEAAAAANDRGPADDPSPTGEPGEAPHETGADPGAAAAGGDPADPEARIAALEAELAELKDNALRAMAEAENVRKRAERQVADANKYGAVSLARDMLSISDNLRRALEAAPPDAADGNELLANLRAGVELTESELQQALARHGVKEITPAPGEKFDHNLHQAMFEMQTDEFPPGSVAQVMQAGYMLNDRLLRAAMVGVAKAPVDLARDEPAGGSAGQADGGGSGGDAA